MSEVDTSGSSFLLAQEQHLAQREHPQHTYVQHSHQQFHRSLNSKGIGNGHQECHQPPVEREIEPGTDREREMERDSEATKTSIVTISIIKEINVDTNGNIIGTKTIQTHLGDLDPFTQTPPSWTQTFEASILAEATLSPPSLPSLPSLPVSSEPTTVAIPIQPSDVLASSAVAATNSSVLGFDAASIQTSVPSLSATNFPSLTAELNSTILISSSSSLSQTYTNSSSSTSTSNSSTRLSSFRSTSLFKSSTVSATESTSTDYLSTSTYLETGVDGGVAAAGTGVAPAGETGSSTTQSSNNSNPGPTPTPTPVVIGGVVGSLAGAAVLIILLLYIIRWRKRSKGILSLGSGNNDGNTSRAQPAMEPSGMTEQPGHNFAVPAALAALTGYSKRFSQKTERTVSSTAGSETGFYRVSGRKLPSVLQTGGDGYGSGLPHDSTMSGSSFYTDSQGFSGSGPSLAPFPISHRKSAGGIPFIRPSPARTPTQEHAPFAFSESVTPPPPPPRRPDVLGRSHVSQDGSHPSRFTEEV